VIRGAQRRVERRLTRQIVDQRPEPALTAPPIEQEHGGRRQAVRAARLGAVGAQRPIEGIQIQRDASRQLPVEPQRVEPVPFAARDGGVPLLEPQRQHPADAPPQREMGELVAQGGGQAVRWTRGQQHHGSRLRERRSFAPAGEAPPRDRVERGSRGREDQANRPVRERADAGERRRTIGRFGERHGQRLLGRPGHRRHATDGQRGGSETLREENDER